MIPVFDLKRGCADGRGKDEDDDDDEYCKKLVSILSTVGFVYVKNHGIPAETIHACRRAFTGFFSQSAQLKESSNNLMKDPTMYGFRSFESEKHDPRRKERDAKEGISFPAHDIRANAFPNSDIETAVIRLVDELNTLGHRMLEMIGIGLELRDPMHFAKAHSALSTHEGESMTAFKVNYYPKLERGLKEDQVLCGEHADFGTITLLIQDQVGGLEVKTSDGQFVEATPIDDTILINIGQMLENWTNGRLRATFHRVLQKANEARMSLVHFLIPNKDVMVEPLEELRVEGDSGRFYGVRPSDMIKKLYDEVMN